MRLIRLFLAFACLLFGIAVAALNSEPVRLDLLWVEFRPPLGLLMLGVLLLGAVLGGAAAMLSRFAQSLESRSADVEPDAE